MTTGGAPDAGGALAGVWRRFGGDGGAGAGAADEPAAHAGGLRPPGAQDAHQESLIVFNMIFSFSFQILPQESGVGMWKLKIWQTRQIFGAKL